MAKGSPVVYGLVKTPPEDSRLRGRFVIVAGSLFNTPVVLISVYAPNWDDVDSINKLTDRKSVV